MGFLAILKNKHTRLFIKLSMGILCFINTEKTAWAGSDYIPPSQSHALEQLLRDKTIDISPLPNYSGSFISLSPKGFWQKRHHVTDAEKPSPVQAYVGASTVLPPQQSPHTNNTITPHNPKPPRANCSPKALVYYAEQAPANFQIEKSGLLYGVKTHTSATRVADMPGYNSCALVVYAILKKAGCKWAKYTASAKAIYDNAYKQGWRPSERQKPGCIVAWNSKQTGPRPRIGSGKHRKSHLKTGVLFRHVGITTGTWMAMDNTSYFSRPYGFITTRPIRYEPPLFLCPPTQKSKK